jgi:hypothetical protein
MPVLPIEKSHVIIKFLLIDQCTDEITNNTIQKTKINIIKNDWKLHDN